MAKVEVFCLIRKKPMFIEQRLADALVKMKRASYDLVEPVKTVKPAQARRSYQTKVVIPEQTPLVADTPISDSFHPDYSQEQVEIEQLASEVVVTDVAVDTSENVDIEEAPKKRGRRKKDAETDGE